MSSQKLNTQDAIGGGITFAIGVCAVVASTSYRMGNIASIGPGVFPAMLGILLMLIGAGLFLTAFRPSGEARKPAPVNLRAIFGVAGALIAFALLMRWFGLVPAIIGCVLVSRLSEQRYGPVQTAILAVGLALASWLIFVVGLNLPLPVMRMP